MLRFLLALFLCLGLGARAVTSDSDTRAVIAAMDRLHQAMVSDDRATLLALTDDELTYGHSTGMTQDRATFIQFLLDGKSPYAQIDFQNPVVSVRGDVAWVRGNLQAKMKNAKGGTDPIEFKILYIFTKEGGAWKLFARQAVK
jgi:ketosteroid isomerase-like protein